MHRKVTFREEESKFYTEDKCSKEDRKNMDVSRQASLYVNNVMDHLGYSYEMIKHRQLMWDDYDKLHNRHDVILPHRRVTTGGKGEGTTMYFESDADFMVIVKDVISAERPQLLGNVKNVTRFQLERTETPPGYTRLKLLELGGKHYKRRIRASAVRARTGSKYLSSSIFTDAIEVSQRRHRLRYGCTNDATSGPSTPSSHRYQKFDIVVCFSSVCPDIVERWISRSRDHGWPAPATIKEISLLDGHVAPVGFKGSQNMYVEWRICYSFAELSLMRCLNATQLKIYVLLKQISKSVLKTVCKDITSYVLKNVILWTCEGKCSDMFVPDLLIDRLIDCIRYLRERVAENYLPSYMIPERNLLAGRLDLQNRRQLARVFTDLLHEGGSMLLRCDKLREAMVMRCRTPVIFREIGDQRRRADKLWMIICRIGAEMWRPGISINDIIPKLLHTELYRGLETEIDSLMKFDRLSLRQMGKTDLEIADLWIKRLTQILS